MAQQPVEIEPSGSLSLFEGGFTLHAFHLNLKVIPNSKSSASLCSVIGLHENTLHSLEAPNFMKTLRLK